MSTFNPHLARAQRALFQNGFKLHPHQIDGVRWLINKEKTQHGGILADDMGLGKTIQMISLIIAIPKKLTLIAVPANLIKQWSNAIKALCPEMPLIIHWCDSRINRRSIQRIEEAKNSIVLTSYGLIDNEEIKTLEVNRLICDEAHTFRNHRTKLFKNLQEISARNRWVMTGTPIQNKLKDLVNLFAFVGIMCSKSNIEEKITNHILRRTKEELQLDLPNIQRKIALIKPTKSEQRFYERIESGSIALEYEIEKILRQRQASISTTYSAASLEKSLSIDFSKYFGNNSKLNFIGTDIPKQIENGKKIIVFTHFKYETEYLSSKLEGQSIKYGVISGSVGINDRNKIIADKDMQVLLVQIVAGGTGLNLQDYNFVYFTSPHFNPSIEEQAVCRVYRIGQTENVIIKHVITKGTYEDRIKEIQTAKLDLIYSLIQK
jgi:SNF2 family DNA or RNA helicase